MNSDAIPTVQFILMVPVCFLIILIGLLLVDLARRSCHGNHNIGDPNQHPHRLHTVLIDVDLAATPPPQPTAQPQSRHRTLQQCRHMLPRFSIVTLSYGTYKDIKTSDQKEAETTTRVGDTECAVCLAEFEAADGCSVLGKCGHIFHTQCAELWLEKNPSCPVCRTSLNTSYNLSLIEQLRINRAS